MLYEIQSALRNTIREGAESVGPFLVHFDAHSDHPFRNYAVPDDGAYPSERDVSGPHSSVEGDDRVWSTSLRPWRSSPRCFLPGSQWTFDCR